MNSVAFGAQQAGHFVKKQTNTHYRKSKNMLLMLYYAVDLAFRSWAAALHLFYRAGQVNHMVRSYVVQTLLLLITTMTVLRVIYELFLLGLHPLPAALVTCCSCSVYFDFQTPSKNWSFVEAYCAYDKVITSSQTINSLIFTARPHCSQWRLR